MTKAVMESEIIIKTTTEVSKDPSYDSNSDNTISYAFTSSSCKMNIELSSYSIIKDVEVNLHVLKPLVVTEDYYSFPSLRDRQQIQVMIDINGKETILSSELRLTVSYETDKGNLRVVEKIIHLPLKILVRVCSPETTATFTTTFKSSGSIVNFSQLFPELLIDYSQKQSSSSSNALGLRHINSGHIVTIVLGISTNRYRVQSNDALAMTLIVQQLLTRLCSRLNPNSDSMVGNIVANISQNHLQLVQGNIDAHFANRQQVQLISNEIALMTTQLRNVEKRVLQSMREKNSRSMASSGLSILLESTYQLLLAQLDKLESAQMELQHSAHKLHGSLKLVLMLIRSNVQDEKYRLIEAAIGFEPQPRDNIDWEEIADVTLAAILRETSKKSEHESSVKQLNWNELKTPRDLAKLKKRFVHAVDRFNKPSDNTVLQEDE